MELSELAKVIEPNSDHEIRAQSDIRANINIDNCPKTVARILASGPVIPNSFAITLGSLIYQFGKAATKLNIKNLVDALSAYVFTMRQRIKLVPY